MDLSNFPLPGEFEAYDEDISFEKKILELRYQAGLEKMPDLKPMIYFLARGIYWTIREHSDEEMDDYESIQFELEYLKRHDPTNDVVEDARNFAYGHTYKLIARKFSFALANDFYNQKQTAKDFYLEFFKYYKKEKYKRLKKYSCIEDFRTLVNDDFVPKPANPDVDDDSDILEFGDELAMVIAACICLNIKISKYLWPPIAGFDDLLNIIKMRQQEEIDFFSNHYELGDSLKKERHQMIEAAAERLGNVKKDKKYKPLITKLEEISGLALYDRELEPYHIDGEYDFVGLEFVIDSGTNASKLSDTELVLLSAYGELAAQLAEDINTRDKIINTLISKSDDAYELAYDPISLKLSEKEEKSQIKQEKKVVSPEPASQNDKNQDNLALLDEIDDLRRRLKNSEADVKRQRELYEKARAELQKVKTQEKDTEKDRSELEFLRRFAYTMSENDLEPEQEATLEEMETYLKEKRVVIVGGHDNWANKLKGKFPKWKFAKPEEQGSVPVSIINNADYVFIFTDHICHPQYNRYMDAIREKKVPMDYVSQVNINNNIKQFYKALRENDEK